MKKIAILCLVSAGLMLTGIWGYGVALSRRPSGQVGGLKLLAAVQTYKDDFKRQGLPVPPSVSLKELINRKLLTDADVSAFQGLDVSINLDVDANRPGNVLVRARLPNGGDIVARTDGSVQELRK